MVERFYKTLLTGFTIGALFTPLVAYVVYLGSLYPASTNILSLEWRELLSLLGLLLLPLASLTSLKIPWNQTAHPTEY